MIEILPIQSSQAVDARRVMAEVCNEIWEIKPTVEELEAWFDATGEFKDINHLQATYFDNGGTFLVAVSDGRVVGTGAVKRLTDDVCELKRMWILKEYRAHGAGLQLAQQLLSFARKSGYRVMRLEVYDPPRQERAVAFYKHLGFSESAPYRESPAKLSMEKVL